MGGPPKEEEHELPYRTAVRFADIVEANGRTIRQNNLDIQHKLPIGALVEIRCSDVPEWDGCRLYVAKHDRDCDGTPLYSLGQKGVTNPLLMTCNGWSDDGLVVIRNQDGTTP